MRKKASRLCLGVAAAVAGLLIVLGVVLKHEPAFYRTAAVDAGDPRKRASTQFIAKFAQFLLDVKNERGKWQCEFTQAEINSFFQEDFVTAGKGEADNLRRLGIFDPRIAFDNERIRFAFRYGSGFWSTVVSYDLRAWAVPKEPNVLAIEIHGRRAGAMPLSSHSFLHELTPLATQQNIEINNFRHDGHPVALLRFQADQPRPTAHLNCLRIIPERLQIAGACPNQAPVHKSSAAGEK